MADDPSGAANTTGDSVSSIGSTDKLQHATEHLETSILEIEEQVAALRAAGLAPSTAGAAEEELAASAGGEADLAAPDMQAHEKRAVEIAVVANQEAERGAERGAEQEAGPAGEGAEAGLAAEGVEEEQANFDLAMLEAGGVGGAETAETVVLSGPKAGLQEEQAPTGDTSDGVTTPGPAKDEHREVSWDDVDQMLRQHGLAAVGPSVVDWAPEGGQADSHNSLASQQTTVRTRVWQLAELLAERTDKCQSMIHVCNGYKQKQMEAEQHAELALQRAQQAADCANRYQKELEHSLIQPNSSATGKLSPSSGHGTPASGGGDKETIAALRSQLAQKDYEIGMLKQHQHQQFVAAEHQITQMKHNIDALLAREEDREDSRESAELSSHAPTHLSDSGDNSMHTLIQIQQMLQVNSSDELLSTLTKIIESMNKLPGMDRFIRTVHSASCRLDNRQLSLSQTAAAIDEAAVEINQLRACVSELSYVLDSDSSGMESRSLVARVRELKSAAKRQSRREAAMPAQPSAGLLPADDVFAGQCVSHFQSLFDIKEYHMPHGILPKMNELYLFVNQTSTCLQVLRTILQLDSGASIQACVAAVEHAIGTPSMPSH